MLGNRVTPHKKAPMTGFLLMCNSHVSLARYDSERPPNLTLLGWNANVCKSGIEIASSITL